MASGASGINAHAAMTPELMRDIKKRVHGTRSMDRLSGLESEHKHPNLIWGSSKRSSSGSGAFVRQRQAAFLRTTSQSSSQSSLGSPESERSGRSSVKTNNNPSNNNNINTSASSNGINRSLSASLPRIPSKTLADRGFSRPSDVKRGREDPPDVDRKVRRLSSSQDSHRSSLTSLRSTSVTSLTGAKSAQQERPAASSSNASSRRSSLHSEKNGGDSAVVGSLSERKSSVTRSDSRPSSSRSERNNNVSVSSSRPSSSSSGRNASASNSSSRPTSSSSDRVKLSAARTSFHPENVLSSSTPRETATTTTTISRTSRQGSGGSKGKDFEGGGENQGEVTGYAAFRKSYKSSSSNRASQDKAVSRSGKRPSFHTIQGSSTPVMQRHARSSSNASSSASSRPSSPPPPPPPPPLPSEETASLGRRDSDLFNRRESLLLPTPPPTPPLSPLDTKDKEEQERATEAVEMRAESLYQPRPPSELSALPLPTPPPTPRTSEDLHSPTLPSPPPPLSPTHLPLDVFPDPPASSRSSSSAASSSTGSSPRRRNEQSLLNKSGSDLEFFCSLPGSLHPDDDNDGNKTSSTAMIVSETAPMNLSSAENAASETVPAIALTTTTTSGYAVEKTIVNEVTTVSNTTMATTTTSSSEVRTQRTESPVIHFPPPPSYSPSLSPDLNASRVSASTSPMSPAQETATFASAPVGGPPSVSTLDEAESRLTSTSTDVVLGYLDNALSGYSMPPTPNDPLSPLPTSPPATETSTAYVLNFNDPSKPSAPSVSSTTTAGITKTTTTTMVMTTKKKESFPPPKTAVNPIFASSSENVTSGTVTSSQTSLDGGGVERLVLLPRKKPVATKQAKRKLSSTQKYEGSVKTVRRQIKPGHVEELREMFLQQEEEEEEERRRRRRSRRARKSRVYGQHDSDDDNDDDNSDGSGYSTTSSDNEYDVEHAEMINSPDYSSSSPFSTPRAAGNEASYEQNWERLGKGSQQSTSSVEDLPRARKAEGKESDRADSSGSERKEKPMTSLFTAHGVGSVGETSFNEASATFRTQQGRSSEAKEKAPIITAEKSLHIASVGDPISTVNGTTEDGFTASLPSLDSQETENKLAEVVMRTTTNTVVEGREKTSEDQGRISSTTTKSTATDWQTRSSSHTEDGIDRHALSSALAMPGHSEPAFRASTAAVATSGTSSSSPSSLSSSRSSLASYSLGVTSPTGSAVRGPDLNPALSLRDTVKHSGVDNQAPAAVARREESDKREVMDANYARSDEALSAKVSGRGGEGVEAGRNGGYQGAVTTTASTAWRGSAEPVGGESGLSTTNNAKPRKEEEGDPLTNFWPNDRNHGDASKGGEEGEIKQSLVSVTVTTASSTTTTTSTFTGRGQTAKESLEFSATPAFSSSTSSPPRHALFGEEDNVPSGQRGDASTSDGDAGSVAIRHRNSLTLSQERLSHSEADKPPSPPPAAAATSFSTFALQLHPDSVESVSSRTYASAQQPESGSGDDFLSILDNIQLDREGFKTESVKRASKLIAGGDGVKGTSTVKDEGPAVVPEPASGFGATGRGEEEEGKEHGERLRTETETVEQRLYTSTLKTTSITPGTPLSVSTTTADAAIQSSSTNITDDDKAITTTATKQQDTENGKADDNKAKMAAVLGELATFNKATKTSHESASAFQSSMSTSSSSSHAMQADAGDVYVYRDNQGDVYVMQDITGQPATTTASVTPATIAVMKTADDDSTSCAASFDFQGLNSSDSVTVDTDHVDAKKAREVISAFFTSPQRSMAHAATAGQDGEQLRGESTISMKGGQEHELSRSFDRSFEVVAGNVGMRQFGHSLSTTAEEEEAEAGARAGRQGELHQERSYGHDENRNLSFVTTGNVGYYSPSAGTSTLKQQANSSESQGQQQIDTRRSVYNNSSSSSYNQHNQPQLSEQNQQFVTVSTTSTAVVGEQTEMQVNIPRNAIHVLPAFPGHPKRSDSTVLRQERVSDETDFASSLPTLLPTAYPSPDSAPQSSSTTQREYVSSRTLHTSQNEYGTPSPASTNFGQQSRSYVAASAQEGVDFSNLRRRSDSSMSSEDGGGNRIRYRLSNLARTDSSKLNTSYTSKSSLKRGSYGRDVSSVNDSAAYQQPYRVPSYKSTYASTGVYDGANTQEPTHDTSFSRAYVTRGIYDSDANRPSRETSSTQQRASYRDGTASGRIYDSAARQSSYDRSSKVTVINNANTSFGENDSQYGSQTSKATSAGDVSPTNTTVEDQHLYRITRSADTTSASLCPSSPVSTPPLPPPQRFTTSSSSHRVVDKYTRATTDYQQRELNRSHDAIFMQPRNNSPATADVWRVDRFSRSEPDLTLPLLSKSLSLLPSEEEDSRAQRYRLVHTDHSGQKVRTRRSSSSDSDESDSGVEGGRKRYKTVTRIQIQGPKKRSNSTGSLANSSELSVFRGTPQPRSPSPPHSDHYRVSNLQRQASWERNRESSRDVTEDHTEYRVTKVSSTEKRQPLRRDSNQEPEANIGFRTVGNVSYHGQKQIPPRVVNNAGDENNNSDHLYQVVHAQSTKKSPGPVTDERDLPTRAEITSRLWVKPGSQSFDESDGGRFPLTSQHGRKVRSVSPPLRPLSPASAPGEQHRTVISIKVNEDDNNNVVAPATHYTETDEAHYRVVNVKSSDQDQAARRERNPSYSGDHNQSFPSPVSGYESDLERGSRNRDSISSTNSKMYTVVNTSAQQQQQQHITTSLPPSSGPHRRPDSPTYDNLAPSSSPSGGRRYVVSSARHSDSDRPRDRAFVEVENISLREVKPRVLSPPPASSTGEWHKTTIDINRNIDRHNPHTLAPIQQQGQSKSYVVFNSSDNIRDLGRHEEAVTRPTTTSSLQRNHSQTSTSERRFRVTSPVPTDEVTAANWNLHNSSGGPNWGLNHSSDSPTWKLSSSRADWNMNSSKTTAPSPPTYRREVYEEKTYEMRQEEAQQAIQPEVPPDEETDLRVLHGKILIQNRLDDSRDHDDFLDNMNVFDTGFHLGKDNPLYQSDPDIYKSLEAELQEQERASQSIGREVTQDITWETVDRIAKRHRGGQVELSPKPRRKQNLSSMLLSKLASIDSKDIHQHIDVQHHHEEIYGDVHLVHADGSPARSNHTSNFDSVHENVELMLKQGKAFVVIKVIAERIVPIDYEFNVWRKSQAIVTRNIEIDLKANEQRRRLYEHVMDTGGRMPSALEAGDDYGAATMRSTRRSGHGEEERQLTSLETLRLFSQILDVAEGKGDQEDTEMMTRQEMGRLPSSSASAMDLLY